MLRFSYIAAGEWSHDSMRCVVEQGEELEPARKRAEQFGVKEIYIDDLREEFVRDYVFPMFRYSIQQHMVLCINTYKSMVMNRSRCIWLGLHCDQLNLVTLLQRDI